MRRKTQREQAREYVLAALTEEVKRRGEIVRMGGGFGGVYRREIARLWTVALRAVRDVA